MRRKRKEHQDTDEAQIVAENRSREKEGREEEREAEKADMLWHYPPRPHACTPHSPRVSVWRH